MAYGTACPPMLLSPYAMSGTDIAYARYAVSGTDIAYVTTRTARSTRELGAFRMRREHGAREPLLGGQGALGRSRSEVL
eukprot:2834553-Rhodomonas_salina.1